MPKKTPQGLRPDAQIPGPSLSSIVKKKSAKTGLALKNTPLRQNFSIFLVQSVIDGLVRNGTQQLLHNFRQMSQTYYKSSNSTFLDHINKKIVFQCGSVEVDARKITTKNWDSDIAHIFRTIRLQTPTIGRDGKGNDKLIRLHVKILSQISSNITTLEIESLRPIAAFDFELNRKVQLEKISKLIGMFPNLKHVKIYFREHFTTYSLDNLELGLRNINPKIKVGIVANYKCEEILDRFGTNPNYSFKIQTRDLRSGFDTFREFSSQYAHMLNWEADLDVDADSTQKLERLVTLCLRHQQRIKNFNLYLPSLYSDVRNGFLDGDESIVRSCLAQLSPMLTALQLNEGSKNWDLLGGTGTSSWSKLSSLKITKYSRNLKFLKYCPALKKLELRVDIRRCFSLSYSSPLSEGDREELKACFGNKPLLKDLIFCGTPLSASDEYQMECKSYLKDLLPAGIKILCLF